MTGPSTISCVDIVTNTARMNLDADNYNNDVDNGQVIPGVYTFTYKVSVPESPGVFKTFTVDYTVNDPCDPPDSLAVPTLTDQSYVIGDTAKTYVHADFVPVPAYCPFDISYTIESLTNTNEPITVVEADKTFTIDYIADLTPVTEGPLNVKITAVSKSKYTTVNTPLTKENDFDVSFSNPCVDSAYVTISAPTIDAMSYPVFRTPGEDNQHPEFTYTASPRAHQLCGEFTYVAKNDDTSAVIGTSDEPLAYNPTTRTFTAYSTDENDIDTTVDYTVFAEFTSYPSATNA